MEEADPKSAMQARLVAAGPGSGPFHAVACQESTISLQSNGWGKTQGGTVLTQCCMAETAPCNLVMMTTGPGPGPCHAVVCQETKPLCRARMGRPCCTPSAELRSCGRLKHFAAEQHCIDCWAKAGVEASVEASTGVTTPTDPSKQGASLPRPACRPRCKSTSPQPMS